MNLTIDEGRPFYFSTMMKVNVLTLKTQKPIIIMFLNWRINLKKILALPFFERY